MVSIQYILLQYNQVQICCRSAGSLAAQCRSAYTWSLFTAAFFPPWPCVHVYAFCQYFCLYLCMVSLTEWASILLITSSLSGLRLERCLVPDQLSLSAKDENGQRLQSHWKTREDELWFFQLITSFEKDNRTVQLFNTLSLTLFTKNVISLSNFTFKKFYLMRATTCMYSINNKTHC